MDYGVDALVSEKLNVRDGCQNNIKSVGWTQPVASEYNCYGGCSWEICTQGAILKQLNETNLKSPQVF